MNLNSCPERPFSVNPSTDRNLTQTIAELQLANRMLADFAALVSHDMQSALRRVVSFSELLGVLPSIEADAHALAFLHTISGSARKLQFLVNNGLAFRNQQPSAQLGSVASSAEPESLSQQIAELKALNAELTDAACSTAQDLRNPLNHILGVAGLLTRLHSIGSDPVCYDMSVRILAGAKQMQRLIEDYLSFINTERHAVKRSRVSMASLVQLARHELEPLAANRRVIWKIDALPEVEGDESMLQQVMLNLLGNSLKYTRKSSEALIEIGAIANSQEWIFSVGDNGIGFGPEAARNLFQKFGKLHTDESFEGTGVGLMIVQYIIQRHGGRVWANATAGAGATFHFTLPRPQ